MKLCNTLILSLSLSVSMTSVRANSNPSSTGGTSISTSSLSQSIKKPVVAKPVAKNRVSISKGIDLVVKGLGLNIDNVRFVKAPKATDYFKYANNESVYAPSLIIAAVNGIKLDRSIRLGNSLTREQFALILDQAISTTGQYATNMMWINIKDEKSFTQNGLNAVQQLVKFNVVTLQNGKFRPKAFLTNAEASLMVKKAAAFVKSQKTERTENPEPAN